MADSGIGNPRMILGLNMRGGFPSADLSGWSRVTSSSVNAWKKGRRSLWHRKSPKIRGHPPMRKSSPWWVQLWFNKCWVWEWMLRESSPLWSGKFWRMVSLFLTPILWFRQLWRPIVRPNGGRYPWVEQNLINLCLKHKLQMLLFWQVKFFVKVLKLYLCDLTGKIKFNLIPIRRIFILITGTAKSTRKKCQCPRSINSTCPRNLKHGLDGLHADGDGQTGNISWSGARKSTFERSSHLQNLHGPRDRRGFLALWSSNLLCSMCALP